MHPRTFLTITCFVSLFFSSVMFIAPKFVTREQFPNASITITDLAGDGNHYSAEVIDESFKDMNELFLC
mgnify:CR=1 FL=1